MNTDLHGFLFSVIICVIRGAIIMYSKIPRQRVDDKMHCPVGPINGHGSEYLVDEGLLEGFRACNI